MVHRVPLVVLFTTLIGLGLGTLVAGPAGRMVGANLGFGVVGALYWYNQLVGFDRTPHVGADGRFDFEHGAGFDKNQFSARERARIANAADPVACAHRLAGEAEPRAAMEAKYGPRAASVTPPTSFMGIGRQPTTPAQRLIQLREVCTPYYDDDHPPQHCTSDGERATTLADDAARVARNTLEYEARLREIASDHGREAGR
jgi:hypothetical protein